MSTFPQRVKDAVPADNEMVIGTVVSGTPLVISARGGTIKGAGRLSSAGMNTGDPVALLRQDATWLALGKVISATGTGFGITDILMSAANLAVSLTAAEQDVPGTSINFNTQAPNAVVLACWFGDFEALAANSTTGELRLRVDGNTLTANVATTRASTNTDRHTAGQMDMFTVGSGAHTLNLRTVRTSGTDATLRVNAGNTTLTVVVLQ